MPIHRLLASSPYVYVRLQANGLKGEYVALIDPGASMSALHPDIIKAFDPQVIGSVDLRQVGKETEMAPTYYFSMIFDDSSPVMGIEVVAAIPASPCDMLIGRDIMAQWLMTWDGPDDRLLISY